MSGSERKDSLIITQVEQAAVLLKPLRLELMHLLDQPRTCTELAAALELTPQKVYYHVKMLQKAGLVALVNERRVRGVMEGLYQAKATSYWLSAELTASLGGARQARSQLSLTQLVDLARSLESAAAELANEAEPQVLTLNASVALADPLRRQEFLQDVKLTIQALAERYGSRGEDEQGASYRLVLACYRQPLGER